MLRKITAIFIAFAISFALCACTEGNPSGEEDFPTESTLSFETQKHEDRINWYGRCYHDVENARVSFSNSSSGFEVAFTGTQLTAVISSTGSEYPEEAAGSAYLYVFLDGINQYAQAVKLELNPDGSPHEVVLAEGLERGPHTLKVLKVTEVKYGTAYLTSLTADGPFDTPPARPARKAEIIGDSILSGSEAVRLSTTTDSKLTASENSLAAYGYLAASEILDAEVSAITRSGALVSGYQDYASIPDYYDYYSAVDRELWDFSAYVPDIVIVDLGTNDVLIGAPVDLITQKYAEFLRYIRGKYPQAAIFVCYGAMTTSLNGALSSMVNSLGDDNVYACALPALATGGHPREQQHQTNGFQLGAIIIRTLGLAGESFQ